MEMDNESRVLEDNVYDAVNINRSDMDKLKSIADQLPGDITVITTFQKSHYNIRWEVQNWKKIGGVISTPKFAIATGHSKDWMLTLKRENKSFLVTLEKLGGNNRSIHVRYKMRVLEVTGKIKGRFGGDNVVSGKSNIVLGKFDNNLSGDNVLLEIHIAVYGGNIETCSSCYDVQCQDLDLMELKRDYRLMLIDPDSKPDMSTYVDKQLISFHMPVICVRAPGLAKVQLAPVMKWLLVKETAEKFRDVLMYIYTGDMNTKSYENDAANMYRAAHECGLKSLQRKCGKCLIEQLSEDTANDVHRIAMDCEDTELEKVAANFINANRNPM